MTSLTHLAAGAMSTMDWIELGHGIPWVVLAWRVVAVSLDQLRYGPPPALDPMEPGAP